jgi:hypothetical protein
LQIPTPTFEEFFKLLEREFGVTVTPAPPMPFRGAQRAVVLSRKLAGHVVQRYVAFRHESERMERDEVRRYCEALAIDPLRFGVRPRGN